jgi:hypothetical protein
LEEITLLLAAMHDDNAEANVIRVLRALVAGKAPGDWLPSVRSPMDRLHVAPMTVRRDHGAGHQYA